MNNFYTQRVGKSVLFSFLLVSVFLLGNINPVKAQCGAGVPTFNVNLTGSPAGSYISPPLARAGNCCGTSSPDRCIQFIITLDSLSVGVNFQIASGAIPPGALFYQVGCGAQQQVGEFICLSGVGPHVLTFCKPGNNVNTYSVTSIPAPIFPNDDTIRVGCSKPISVLGLKPATATWQSIFPGAPGQYNSYLSCTTGCTDPSFTPPASGYPAFVDYKVCGFPLADKCGLVTEVCDTIRMYIKDILDVTVNPTPATYCPTSPGVNLTANVTGGSPPYVYIWKNPGGTIVGGNQSYFANAPGNYTLEIRDNLVPPCPVKIITVPVSIASISLGTTQTNVSCNGGSDGTATVNASGGAPPYTYSWTGGQTTQTATGLAAGVYNVVVTDAGGCTNNINVTITEPAVLSASVSSQSNVGCQGEATGSIDLTVSGGVGPYTFLWNNGETTEDIFDLSANTYNVLVTDSKGCTTVQGATITEPGILYPLITSATVGGTNIACNGGTDGTASVSVTGGTAPFSYLWSTGATTQNISGLGAGSVSVTVNDVNGCSATASSTLTEPSPLSSVFNSTSVYFGNYNVSCNGASDGSFDFDVSGGTAPYSFLWSNGDTTEDLTGLTAGTYTVTVTDDNGCILNDGVILSEPAILVASVTGQNNAGCNGENSGYIDLTTSGGAAPYTFSWSNGATTEDISNLYAGNYTVTITDANLCVSVQAYTITEPAVFVPLITSATVVGGNNISCNGGSDGTATVNITGGTMPYSYSWSTGATTPGVTGLSAGIVSVFVSDDNGCTANDSFNMTEPDALGVTNVLSSYAGGYNISCFGASDGSIDITISGGTPLYSYLWSNGETTQNISGLTEGPYNVTVTDANGCDIFEAFTLFEPVLLTGTLTPFVQPSGTNVSCIAGLDGEIDLEVNGGVGPFTFAWSNGATSEDINGLASGNYSVIITDANGCTTNTNVTLTEPATAVVVTSISSPTYPGGWNVSCNGGVDGAVDITVAGGSPPYTYSWSNGDTTQNITGVSVFTYYITVTDVNGCTALDSITLTEPALVTSIITPVVQPSGSNISCEGGSDGVANLVVNGGTAPYTFLWSNGATTQDLMNVPAGLYSVTITDVNGCVEMDFVTLTEPTLMTSSYAVSLYFGGNNVTCNGALDGFINITVNDGSSPYTYSWSNGATTQNLSGIGAGLYTLTITDNNGCTNAHNIFLNEPAVFAGTLTPSDFNGSGVTCNGATDGFINLALGGGTPPYTYSWSTGATTQNIVGLGAGNYTVTATDDNGCTFIVSETITEPVVLAGLLDPSVYPGGFNVTCAGNDGDIDLIVSGGTAPYSYLWNNASTNEDLTGLAAGTYTVTVTDANNCTVVESITLSSPGGLSASATANIYAGGYNITCNGFSDGMIDLTVVAGVAPYTYLWSTGDTTEDLAGLPAGTYSVVVTDDQGCNAFANITLFEPAILSGSSVTTNYNGSGVTCNAECDGAISFNPTGGTGPYTYFWSNAETTQTITGLCAGTYDVTVTDANGCTFDHSTTITEPAVLAASEIHTNAFCNSSCDGTIDVTVAGGTMPYTYLWSNGETTEDIIGLCAGTYDLVITDDNNCQFNISVVIGEPVQLSSMIDPGMPSCNTFCNGSADLTVFGGTAPYTFLWSNGDTTEDISALCAGTYDVIITDVNGCIWNDQIIITEPLELLGTAVIVNANCNGNCDGEIDLTMTGGTAPYTYLWSNGATTEDLTGLCAGPYDVTVTDDQGCVTVLNFSIAQPSELSAGISLTAAISCNGVCDGEASVIGITGGTLPYTYLWSNGNTTDVASGLCAGPYSVTITDGNGCILVRNIVITEPAILTAVVSPVPVSCFGACDGTASVAPSGGTSPYTYAWSNGDTGALVSNLCAGPYSVTITDANGCIEVVNFTITEPVALLASAAAGNQISCAGACDGSIDLTVNGGLAPYTYLWSNGATTEDLSGLCEGTYDVIVTDANGCDAMTSITITEPAPISTSGGAIPVTCNGGNDGEVDITVIGGTAPYTFLWSNGATTEDISGLAPGLYSVTITDLNGCFIDLNFTITEPAPVVADAGSAQVICGNSTSLNAVLPGGASGVWTVSSGSGTFNNPNDPNTSVTGLATGSNTFVWTISVGGCTDSDDVTVNSSEPVTATVTPGLTLCEKTSTIFAQNPTVGMGSWSVPTGATTNIANPGNASTGVSNLSQGINMFIWTVVNGPCVARDTVFVTLDTPANCEEDIEMPTAYSPNGDGQNDDFWIKGLSKYPDNTFLVFNRWGNEVYAKTKYYREWVGDNKSGDPLPDGTYYVILKVNNYKGATKVFKGYVDMRR